MQEKHLIATDNAENNKLLSTISFPSKLVDLKNLLPKPNYATLK